MFSSSAVIHDNDLPDSADHVLYLFRQSRINIMPDHLVISALGSDQPGIVTKLTSVILDRQCNISDSRMAVLGGDFAVILLVNGETTDIAHLQQQLADQQEQLGLTIISKATQAQDSKTERQSCIVDAVALDHPGIVQNIAGFFAERNINIENLSTGCYHAPHTGTPMFELQMQINIASSDDINKLRQQFINFCDELNIDASLEAVTYP